MRVKKTESRFSAYRTPDCVHYQACLSEAAWLDTGLSCKGCQHFRASGGSLTWNDVEGCARLLAEVFRDEPVRIALGVAAKERDQAEKRGGRWVQQVKVAVA